MPETLLEMPSTLEKREPITKEKLVKHVEQMFERAPGRDQVSGLPKELLIDADDAALTAPLFFNKSAATFLLGEGYEPVLEETVEHVIKYVAQTMDPGSYQSFIALVTNPIVAKQIWGTGWKQHVRAINAIAIEDIAQGQRKVSRNGRVR